MNFLEQPFVQRDTLCSMTETLLCDVKAVSIVLGIKLPSKITRDSISAVVIRGTLNNTLLLLVVLNVIFCEVQRIALAETKAGNLPG